LLWPSVYLLRQLWPSLLMLLWPSLPLLLTDVCGRRLWAVFLLRLLLLLWPSVLLLRQLLWPSLLLLLTDVCGLSTGVCGRRLSLYLLRLTPLNHSRSSRARSTTPSFPLTSLAPTWLCQRRSRKVPRRILSLMWPSTLSLLMLWAVPTFLLYSTA
jgi:hypothetical protein